MKHLLAILFALLTAAPASAQLECPPPAARYVHAGQLGANWFIWWWCADGRYQWTPIIPGDYTSDRLAAATAWAFGVNPGYMKGKSWRPGDDPLMIELAAAARVMATADTDRPPRQAWSVAKNASYKDRPTYPVTDGVRGTKSDGRANVGEACDCSTPIVEGKTTYCPRAAATGGITSLAAQSATSVAVCTQAGP